jgi:GxxExxY protein
MTDEQTKEIIGAAIAVHRHLGPGLLESAYEECLCYELKEMGIPYSRQVPLPVVYKGVHLDCGYKIDLMAHGSIVVELKTVERLLPIHEAQLLTYLRLSSSKTGLLINFNSAPLKDGIRRMVL